MIEIESFQQALPHGITLSCRAAGKRGRPVLMFLHGFPEAAFVWDTLLKHFSQPENGGYRCIAPNLRGFENSSSPTEVSAYRVKFLMQDIAALVAIETADSGAQLACLVAHDWGGSCCLGRCQPNAASDAPTLHHQFTAYGYFYSRAEKQPKATSSQRLHEFLGTTRL